MPVPQEFRGIGTKRQVVPFATATPTPMASTPPVMQSSPSPVQQPIQNQSVPQQKTSGLQKVFNALAVPSKALGGFLQGTRQSAEGRVKELQATGGKPRVTDYIKALGAGVKNIPSGIKNNITPSKAMSEYSRTDPISTAISKFNTNGAGAFATDMVADPLNLIPFGLGGKLLTKGSKFVSKVAKLDKIVDFAKSNKLIYTAIETVNPYFRVPEFKKLVEAGDEASRIRLTGLYEKIASLSKGLSRNDQIHIGQILENKATPLTSKAAKIASEIKNISKQIGQEAVDAGKMTKKVFKDMTKKGYMSHVLLDNNVKHPGSAYSAIQKVIGNQFKKRTGKLTENIKEFAPAVFKGLGSEIKDLEIIKVFKNIAEKYGTKIGRGGKALPGYVRASEVGIKGEGFAKAFKNIQVPEAVADYLTKIRPGEATTLGGKAYEGYRKYALNPWKVGKTILNPAYHIRNLVSNQILSSMGTGKNIVSTTINYIRRIPEFRSGKSVFYNTAKQIGLIGRKSFGSNLDELVDAAGLGVKKNLWERITKNPKAFQNFSEESAKFNVFKTSIEKFANEAGTTVSKALKNNGLITKAKNIAEEAVFSPYKINQTERSLLSKFIPFYSFTRQALPFTVKSLINNPKSIAQFGKIKDIVERKSEDPGVELPSYMKNQIRLPFKDKEGNNKYLDPGYVYPFGNFLDSKGVFGLSGDPFAMEAIQQLPAVNKDFYYNQPIRNSNLGYKNVYSTLQHIYRTAAPQLLVSLTTKLLPALLKWKQGNPNSKIGDAILSLIGVKLTSPNMQDLQESNLRSKNAEKSSIEQEMSKTLRSKDPTFSREEKERDIQNLREKLQ